jgi:hypothetical protein
MAITLPITGVTSVLTASRSPSFTLGTAPAEGDVIVLFCGTADTATVAEPAGWVNVLGAGVDVESDSNEGVMVYHVVTKAEAGAGTVTWTLTNLFGATETGRNCTAVLRGVDTRNPLCGSGSTFDSANAPTPWTLASITPTANECVVIRGVGGNANQTITSPPASHTLQSGSDTTNAAFLYSRDATGSSGVNIAATNLTPSVADEYVSISAAFRPGLNPLPLVIGQAVQTSVHW